jgi:ATP-binding cassette subfamily C protein
VNRELKQYFSTLHRGTGWRLIATILLATLCSLTEGIGILLLIPSLQVAGLNLVGQGSVGRYAVWIDSGLRWIHLAPTLPVLLFIFLVLISTRTITVKLQMVTGATAQQKIQSYLRERLHGAIVGADWLFLCRRKSADLIHVLTREVERVGMATIFTLLLAGDLLVTVIYIGVASALSPAVTMIVLGAGVILTILLWERTKAIQGIGSEVSRINQLLYGAIIGHVQNLKATKAYSAESYDREAFAALNSTVSEIANEGARKQGFSSGLFEIGSFLILSAAIYLSIRILAVGPATILILLLVFARLMPRLVDSHAQYQSIVNHLPAFTAIADLERECLAASEQQEPNLPLPRLSHRIELRKVSFAYRMAVGSVINNVSMDLIAGQTAAFIGPSGSGKSTLADLIIGLLHPDMGTIAIDGAELRDANRFGWRAQIGYVSQDTVLFHDSLRSNLAWARRGVSEDEMWQVLKLAAAEDLVRRLPNGLDTMVGDRGAFLSHGERQRIAIARALLRKPALLVLDEATNSLDGENEARVLEAIDNLHGNLTILLIAHRFSTIKRADAVYVLDHGRIVESGSWASLAHKDHSFEFLPDRDELHAHVAATRAPS